MIDREHWNLQAKGPGDALHKLEEIFANEGLLNKNLRIKHQNKRYWISCDEDRFFAYQINENCGLGPGVPGWPVCIIRKDYVYDESEIPDFPSTKLNMHDWLDIIANKNFELL